jgi:Flp pilus assembly protein TadD
MTMTMTTQNPTTPAASTGRTGFQSIPTRIRDLRDAQVPPLVVDPIADTNKIEAEQSLGELGGKLAEVHGTAAEAFLTYGSYDKALPHLEAAVLMASGDAQYQHQLGVARYLLGDDDGAVQSFNAVLTQDPQNGEAWFNMGMVLFGKEQFGDAETCFGRSLAMQPSDAQAWNNRGVCLWRMERKADARACFQKALQINPNDADATFNLGAMG